MSQAEFPAWLHGLSIASLAVAFACAAFIVADEARRPQAMWIMNMVWPLTALFGSLLWLAGYLAWGRVPTRADQARAAQAHGGHMQMGGDTPFAIAVAKGSSHCGAGCTLGDIVAEWLAFAVPAVAVAFGWKTLFAEKTFAVWGLDLLVAFLIGIVFQYFSIKPMRDLTPGQALVQALKADAASIVSWQVGMYAVMALIQFGWFAHAFGGMAEVDTPEFWFAMQLAMLAGFVTSYPVNWLLLKAGVKERM